MFDPIDFLLFAQALVAQQRVTEVDIRNAVSRAYYSAFLYSRERMTLKRLFFPTGSGQDHALLVQRLRGDSNGDLVALGNVLDALRTNRNNADYNLSWSASGPIARFAVFQASTIVNDVDRLLPV